MDGRTDGAVTKEKGRDSQQQTSRVQRDGMDYFLANRTRGKPRNI